MKTEIKLFIAAVLMLGISAWINYGIDALFTVCGLACLILSFFSVIIGDESKNSKTEYEDDQL